MLESCHVRSLPFHSLSLSLEVFLIWLRDRTAGALKSQIFILFLGYVIAWCKIQWHLKITSWASDVLVGGSDVLFEAFRISFFQIFPACYADWNTFSSLFVLCRNKIMPVARTKECFVGVRELQLWTKKAHTVNTTWRQSRTVILPWSGYVTNQ